jgi:large subunit ribosomal protein L24e
VGSIDCRELEKGYMQCTFCREKIPKGRGKMWVKTTGQILYFCNSKCQNNWKLGREGKKTKWTESFRKHRGK